MLKNKNRKFIIKRSSIYIKNKKFKLKVSKSNKKHLLLNKNKFSKKYLRSRIFIRNKNFLKKFVF